MANPSGHTYEGGRLTANIRFLEPTSKTLHLRQAIQNPQRHKQKKLRLFKTRGACHESNRSQLVIAAEKALRLRKRCGLQWQLRSGEAARQYGTRTAVRPKAQQTLTHRRLQKQQEHFDVPEARRQACKELQRQPQGAALGAKRPDWRPAAKASLSRTLAWI